MSRRTFRLLLSTALGILLLAYVVLSSFARRPLNPSEFWIFAAAVLRATPAHLGSSNPLETLRLGGAALGAPAQTAALSTSDQTYTIPLPPRTVQVESPYPQVHRFITFATPEERHQYLHSTLPQAGWRYREQLGSMHALEGRDLLLSVQSTFYVGTRVGELRISLQARPRRAA